MQFQHTRKERHFGDILRVGYNSCIRILFPNSEFRFPNSEFRFPNSTFRIHD